jgi:hypothetical protein
MDNQQLELNLSARYKLFRLKPASQLTLTQFQYLSIYHTEVHATSESDILYDRNDHFPLQSL